MKILNATKSYTQQWLMNFTSLKNKTKKEKKRKKLPG